MCVCVCVCVCVCECACARVCVCVCERESKEKQEGFLLSRETYIRIIVIDLIIVKLFRVYPVVFPFKKKGFFT